MPHSSTAVIQTGVDTLTCSVAWEGGIHSFISLAQWLLAEDQLAGSKVVPFKRGSYRGETSRHVGLAFAPGRVLAELRGGVAHEFWPHFLERAEKVSRLDVEVSVRQVPYDHQMAVRIWQGERAKDRPVGKPAKARLQAEDSGGSTLYLGTGASRSQGRLYERFYKTRLDEDKDVWRYEVQTRRERAVQVADLLLRSPDPQSDVPALVHGYFARRGVHPIFNPTTHLDLAPLPTPTTDRDRSLQWLSDAVHPALERHRLWGSYEEAKKRLALH